MVRVGSKASTALCDSSWTFASYFGSKGGIVVGYLWKNCKVFGMEKCISLFNGLISLYTYESQPYIKR